MVLNAFVINYYNIECSPLSTIVGLYTEWFTEHVRPSFLDNAVIPNLIFDIFKYTLRDHYLININYQNYDL